MASSNTLDKKKWLKILFFASMLLSQSACSTLFSLQGFSKEGLILPFLKNSPNECYFLDEFMPVPNNMVSGKSGSINLRYYTYLSATYKDWVEQKRIILSFYSKDGNCWSLFEEYYVAD